jgi:hypothetical protein
MATSVSAYAPDAVSPAGAPRRKRTYSARIDSAAADAPSGAPSQSLAVRRHEPAHACDTREALNCVGGSADDIHDDHDAAVDVRYFEHERGHMQWQERRIRSKIQELCKHEQKSNAHVYEVYPERWQDLLGKAAALADVRVAAMRESHAAFFFHVGTCLHASPENANPYANEHARMRK